MVTTSRFAAPAQHAAEATNGHVTLLDGGRLLRYIAYVGGSRLNGRFAGDPVASPPIDPKCLLSADAVQARTRRPPRTTRVLALANNRGGIGKTTTAVHVGFLLAEKYGKRVLLVDMDSQQSLSQAVPAPGPKSTPPPRDTEHLTEYFTGQQPLGKLIRPTRFDNLFITPGHPKMSLLDTGGGARPLAELQFVDDVRMVRPFNEAGAELDPFDWVILDTPPAQTYFTRAPLATADYVVVPANAESFAVSGLRRLFDTARTIGALMGSVDGWKERMLGCLITRWKPSKEATAAAADLEVGLAVEGSQVFAQRIPFDDKVGQGYLNLLAGGWRNIFHLGNQPGPAAQAYDQFVKEMLEHVNRIEAQDLHC